MNSIAKSLVICVPLVFLAGCGGSGGDGIAPALVADPAEITSQNAPVIAGAVLQTALEGGGLGSFAVLGSGAGSILGDPTSRLFSKLGEIHNSQTESLRQKAQIGALQDSIPPQTTPCLNSGSVTVSGEINNPLTLSATDTFTLVFSACDDGAGVVSGTYAMRITGFTGDFVGGSFAFDVTVTLSGFQITDAGETITANGAVSISLDTSSMPTLTLSVASTSLSVSDGTSSHTLADFSVIQTVDEVTFAFTMDASGALTSSSFTGRVTFTTAVSLQGDGVGYASNGELRITGAGNASISILVLDSVFIRLEIDLDGNGVPEEIVDTTWDGVVAQS